MIIGIVGNGTVGRALTRLFAERFEVVVYDKFQADAGGDLKRDKINHTDVVFVAVPTPTTINGCDLTAVEEVVRWVKRPMCIKSTVPPGTTSRLALETGKEIVFSPEYTGETVYHRYRNARHCDLVAIGGVRESAERFLGIYKAVLGPEPRYFLTDATTAEIAKYMENCFFATKVAFVAQFYLIAKQFGADFHEAREIWVADSRVGTSHSAVIDSLGFAGKCLPKDLAAIISAAEEIGGNVSLLEAVQKFNNALMDNSKEIGSGMLKKN